VAELLPKIPSALHAASPPRSILDLLRCFLAGPCSNGLHAGSFPSRKEHDMMVLEAVKAASLDVGRRLLTHAMEPRDVPRPDFPAYVPMSCD
jgi:hypothetical protein